jgi:hypothetical protein
MDVSNVITSKMVFGIVEIRPCKPVILVFPVSEPAFNPFTRFYPGEGLL